MRRRNPDGEMLALLGLGVLAFLYLRRRATAADPTGVQSLLGGGGQFPQPLSNVPPPSYAGWPSAFGGAYASDGSPCTTSNGQPGTWRRVAYGAVQVGGIPQQWVCWPRGVPVPS